MHRKKFFIIWLFLVHALMIVVLFKSDFISRVKARLGYAPELTEHYWNMRGLHQRMDASIPDNAVLFIGDSITQSLAVSAVTPLAVNLGIGTDTTIGVLDRLETLSSLAKARLIVIAIGYNDLARRNNDQMMQNYARLLDTLPEQTPVIVSAVLPVASRHSETEKRQALSVSLNQRIVELNQRLAELCAGYPQVTFLDGGVSLRDASGELATDYHVGDGIHLNDAGYAVWISALRKAVKERMQKEWPGPDQDTLNSH